MSTITLPHQRLLSDQVSELIENQIIAGELAVGDKLPTEAELAELYKVSRTVIREALTVLKEKGWLNSRAGKGTYIISNTGRGVDASLDVILRMNPVAGFDHLLEVRECLEPEVAALAAVRASEAQIHGLHQLIQVMNQSLLSKDTLDEFLEADYQFHHRLAEATGNPLMSALISALGRLMRSQQRMVTFDVPGGPERALFYHSQIASAVQAHLPEVAREQMRGHIQQVKVYVQSVPRQDWNI